MAGADSTKQLFSAWTQFRQVRSADKIRQKCVANFEQWENKRKTFFPTKPNFWIGSIVEHYVFDTNMGNFGQFTF